MKNMSDTDYSNAYYIEIYGYLIAISLLTGLIHAIIYSTSMSLSARRLHDKMFSSLLRLPINFFEKNDSGICIQCDNGEACIITIS